MAIRAPDGANKMKYVLIGNKNGDDMIEAGYDKKCGAHNEDT